MTAAMRRLLVLSLLLPLAAPVAAPAQPLGVFGLWGAFRDEARCYAISEASRTNGRPDHRPFVAIGHWPGRGLRGQLHVRLSRDKRAGSAILVRIDGETFQLRGGGRDAWAPDPAADEAIARAMRSGIDMVVETRSAAGLAIRDHYPLRGAATAIDAAALACARRR